MENLVDISHQVGNQVSKLKNSLILKMHKILKLQPKQQTILFNNSISHSGKIWKGEVISAMKCLTVLRQKPLILIYLDIHDHQVCNMQDLTVEEMVQLFHQVQKSINLN